MSKQFDKIDGKIALTLEKLMQVQRVLLWEVSKKENLSPIQIQFLIFLNKHSDHLRKVSVLADEFDLTKATVSDAVTSLVAKGLVKKVQVDNDRRSFTLDLTPEGKKILTRIDSWQEILSEHIGKISSRDKEKVFQFLNDLIKILFDAGIINIARMCLTCGNMHKGKPGRPNSCSLTGRTFSNSEINLNCDNYECFK